MKTERIHLRITPEDKRFLQEVADKYFDGVLSAVFDDMIAQLKEREGKDDE
jgi:hypothetical protein